MKTNKKIFRNKKIPLTVLLLLFNLSNANAEGTAEAMVAIIDAGIQKYMDDIQLEVGAAAAFSENTVSPEIHLGLNYHYLKRFNFGISSDFPIQNKPNVPNFNFGVVAGMKNFTPMFGQHYYNINVGGSILENGNGIYVEPQIKFILSETRPVKFFLVMHSIGVSATIALRHIFITKNTDILEDSNTLLLRVDFFLKQRKRQLK